MHNHSSRFIDNDQMIILEDDLELDIFGGRPNFDRLLENDFIHLAFKRGRLAFSHDSAVAGDSPFGNKLS